MEKVEMIEKYFIELFREFETGCTKRRTWGFVYKGDTLIETIEKDDALFVPFGPPAVENNETIQRGYLQYESRAITKSEAVELLVKNICDKGVWSLEPLNRQTTMAMLMNRVKVLEDVIAQENARRQT